MPHTNPVKQQHVVQDFYIGMMSRRAIGRKYGLDQGTVARILEYNKQSDQPWLDQIREQLREILTPKAVSSVGWAMDNEERAEVAMEFLDRLDILPKKIAVVQQQERKELPDAIQPSLGPGQDGEEALLKAELARLAFTTYHRHKTFKTKHERLEEQSVVGDH